MKKEFLTKTELDGLLPWSRNIVSGMVRSGIFRAVRNPAVRGRAKMFFWRPQVEAAIAELTGIPRDVHKKERPHA